MHRQLLSYFPHTLWLTPARLRMQALQIVMQIPAPDVSAVAQRLVNGYSSFGLPHPPQNNKVSKSLPRQVFSWSWHRPKDGRRNE